MAILVLVDQKKKKNLFGPLATSAFFNQHLTAGIKLTQH